jgi:hypothetical protein
MNGISGGVASGPGPSGGHQSFNMQSIGSVHKQSGTIGAANGVNTINEIFKDIQSDLKHIKTQMENIPPFPKGQAPPTSLAKF